MHIERLELMAFGPFTDFQFEFGEQAGGLHIVYGTNEAGKSSSLRGLKALLFGFDERTPDNHLHNNDKLRVAGVLRNTQGDSLALVRRKGRKSTLLSPQGDVLDDTVLLPYLGGVSTEMFDTLFGIDHRALVQGGQDILDQKGDVGQALFAASLGTHTVHRVLQALESEAADLFRNKGSTQTINALLKTHRDLQANARRTALLGRQWDEQRREVDSIHALQTELDEQLRELQARQHRLQRMQRVAPLLAEYDRVLAQQAALPNVVVLAADFSVRHRTVKQALVAAQASTERLRQEHLALTASLATVPPDEALLGVQSTLDTLHQEWPRFHQLCADVPVWEAEREQRRQQLNKALANLGLAESASPLLIVESLLRHRKSLLALAEQGVSLTRERQTYEERRRDALLRVDKLRRALAELDAACDSQVLRLPLRQARSAAPLQADLQRCERDLAAGEIDCDHLRNRLTGRDKPIAALVRLPVPRREQIMEHENRLSQLQQDRRELLQRERELQAELTQLATDLDTLVSAGDVPTDADVQAQRQERDQHWSTLRTAGWQGTDQQPSEVLCQPLDHYETLVQQADGLADRLRREADRVQRKVQLVSQQGNVQRRLTDIQQQIEQANTQGGQQQQTWQALWQTCGIELDTPAAMLAWFDDWDKLVGLAGLQDQRMAQRDVLRNEIAAVCQSLYRAFDALALPKPETDDLHALADLAQDYYERLEQQAERRASVQRQLSEQEAEQDALHTQAERCAEACQMWARDWQQAVTATQWPGTLAPTMLPELLAELAEVKTIWHAQEELSQRLQQAQHVIDSFTAQVRDLAQGLLNNRWHQRAVDVQLEQLLYQLGQERDYQVRRNTLNEQLQRAEHDQLAAQSHEAKLQAELRLLCKEAGVSQPDQLEKAERDSAEYEHLQGEQKRLHRQLLQESPGISLAELRGQIADTDVDALPGELAGVVEALEALDQRRKEAQQAYGRAHKEFELLQGGEAVAELAVQAQSCLADIQHYSEHYVRCRVAAALLRHHIERFRQENQGPLVRRASDHFRQLTCGRYSHLKVEFSDRDEAVLMGVRENAELNVLGMSAGTRDQLYLSLRLAALERYLDAGEPLPFIVDDILIEFDDQRSLAALRSLAQLAERTQVILFTHHSRIVEQVKQVEGVVRLYELASA